MRTHDRLRRLSAAAAAAAAVALALCLSASCARDDRGAGLKLDQSRYGFFPGETKNEVLERSRNVATVSKAPDPPLGYRGELWDFSRPLEPHPEVDHVRLAFFEERVVEIIVYFRDTSPRRLEMLRRRLEGELGTAAVAEDGEFEMAQKTYRLGGPGISVTLRRITKKESTELYVQYLHDELHRRLVERNVQSGGR